MKYFYHNIEGETLIDCWPLHSQSNTFDYFDDQLGDWRMYQFPHCNLQSFTETGANLRGYTFFIKYPVSAPGVSINEWYPIDPAEAQLAYTAYTTTIDAVNENITAADNVSLFPNPASEDVNIKISNHKGGQVAIRVYDVSGHLVYEEITNVNQPGNYLLELSLEDLTSGLYLIQMSSESSSTTLKFRKQ